MPASAPGSAPESRRMTRLETPRLVIRTFAPGDAEAWLALVNDPRVTRFLPPSPEATMDRFRDAIAARHAMERELGYAIWAVDDKATGAFIGQCGMRPIDEGPVPEVELAYHYTAACWSRGYGTEAVVAVLAHGLGPLGLERIVAVAMAENIGSWRVMEKAGMHYQGVVDYFGLNGLRKYVADRAWWAPPAGHW